MVIALLNRLLLAGQTPLQWVLFPDQVAAGEWWRLLTHPFVHVTWYHLLLDAGAFLLLYEGLRQPAWWHRVLTVMAGSLGALLTSWLTVPDFNQTGLCGLSGVAHGLMAVAGLEMALNRNAPPIQRRAGWIALGLVAGKAAWEGVTGTVALEWLHFGLMGTPLAASHVGGVLGGIAVFFLLRRLSSPCPRPAT